MADFNIYCDESCHLQHDQQKVMVLGAVMCPLEKTREIAERIRELKRQHGLDSDFEIKWTKVSPGQVKFYLALIDYFFDDDDLAFRALVVPNKDALRHADFGQTHDDFYYKMYFDLLKVMLKPGGCFNIYVDIKDSRSADKTRRLHDVLANNAYDFQRQIVRKIETIRSHQVQQAQIADLLIGAIAYLHRNLDGNSAKLAVVKRMQQRSHYSLRKSTLLLESKTNLFVWVPRPVNGNV